MATNTVTPTESAASAAPSTPVESTPVSTPVSQPEVSTPVQETPAQPEVQTPERPKFDPTKESEEAYLSRVRRERAEAAQKAAEKPEVKPEAKPVEPKTEAEPKPEDKAEEPKPEETPEAEDDPEREPFQLEQVGPLPPKELAQLAKEDPRLQELFKEKPELRDKFFANSRLASKAIKFNETFPGGVEEAQYAKEQAQHFGTLDDHFTSIAAAATPQAKDNAFNNLMNYLWNLDVVLDPESGQPLMDAKGQPIVQGNVEGFIRHFSDHVATQRTPGIIQSRLQGYEDWANELLEQNPDNDQANEILAAVNVLKAAEKNGGPASTKPKNTLTPEQQAREQELQRREEETRRQDEAKQASDHQERENRIGLETDKQVDAEISSLLKNTDLPETSYKRVTAEIRDAVADLLEKNPLFTSRRDWIMRARWSPTVEKQRIAHNVNSMREVLANVVRQKLKDEGITITRKQAERNAKIATQVQASKSEPKGLASPASPAQQPSGREAFREVLNAWVTKNQRQPNDAETTQLMAQWRQKMRGNQA